MGKRNGTLSYRRSFPKSDDFSSIDPNPAASIAPNQNYTTSEAEKGFPTILAILFLPVLLFPIRFQIGPILLLPYRLWLLLLFIPLFIALLRGRAGPILIIDWCIITAALWAVISLAANHSIGIIIEPAGVHTLEFLGAYLLGRVAIRSADDFERLVKAFFLVVATLLPFVVFESFKNTPILLKLLGEDNVAVDIGQRMGLRRAQATFEHPILYGAFVSSCLGVAWYVLSPKSAALKRLWFATTVGAATVFSLSTGALLSYIVQGLLILWEAATRPFAKRWTVFGLGVAAAYIIVDLATTKSPFHAFVRYATFSMQSSYNRILIWKYGFENVLSNPLFGLGMNEWTRPRWLGSSVDNFWLFITMAYGVPFMLLVSAALIMIVRKISLEALQDYRDQACRAGYLTTLGGIILAGATVHYWKGFFAFVLFFIGSGVWIISRKKVTKLAVTSQQEPQKDHLKERSVRYSRTTSSQINPRGKNNRNRNF